MSFRIQSKGGKYAIKSNGGRGRAPETAGLGHRRKETTAFGFGGSGGITGGRGPSGASQSNAYLLGADVKDSMLEGILDTTDPHALQGVYRDIYLSDHICGAAVDLKATMPWSSFTLTGGTDEQLAVFYENIDRLNMHRLHYDMSVDKMVSGNYVGVLAYDPRLNGFTDMINLNIADVEVMPTPLYSEDPILYLNVPKEYKDFCNDTSEAAKRIQKKIPTAILNAFRAGSQVELSPISTLYLARTSLSTIQTGLSIYRRILPIYLIERMLFRGTLTEISRRQRATLHITAGSDEWVPTEPELQSLVGLFQSTEADPISSVVATRTDVNVAEIRCLSGDTLLEIRHDGFPETAVKLRDIVSHNPDELQEGYEYRLSHHLLQIRNHKNEWADIDSWIYQGYKQTYHLTFSNGTRFDSTANHKFLTIGYGFERSLVCASELRGKYVAALDGDYIPAHIVKELTSGQVDTDLVYEAYADGQYAKLLDQLYMMNEELCAKLTFVLDNRYQFVQLDMMIPKGHEHVYDLHMAESNSPIFNVSGILTKNSAGDFLKWTDLEDQFTAMKYKALGINESFLTGDTSYNSMETALSVFIEDLRAGRDKDTRQLYYDKLFPLISQINGFEPADPKGNMETSAANRVIGWDTKSQLNDKSRLLIPEIHWHKQLRPEADGDYMEMLNGLTEKGLPVPLRMLAAAAGLNFDKIKGGMEQDAKDRKEIKKLYPDQETGALSRQFDNLNGHKRVGVLDRDYGETAEVVGRTKTGKKKYIHNQKKANRDINETAAKALHNLADRDIYQAALRRAGEK